jgi:ribosomal protein S18 acetylase RimI-like enzyme
VIRRASSADLPALLALCVEHAAYERLPHQIGCRAEVLAAALDTKPPLLYAWVACLGDATQAYASATLDFSTLDRSIYLHMDCLYVREQWRNRSIDQQLWETIRVFAHANHCHTIQWQTPVWNVEAARLYRRIGAKETTKLRYSLSLEGND